MDEERGESLRYSLAHGCNNLVGDEVAEPVENEDTEEVSSKGITPLFVADSVLRWGCVGYNNLHELRYYIEIVKSINCLPLIPPDFP